MNTTKNKRTWNFAALGLMALSLTAAGCNPQGTETQAAIDAMKVHGGYGYSTEFEVERLYRDSILMSIGEGTNDILRTVVAKSLIKGETRVG